MNRIKQVFRKEVRNAMIMASAILATGGPVFAGEVSSASPLASHQPVNLGAAKRAALAYYESGQYQKDFDAVIAQARDYIFATAPSVRKPAIVLDIDETTLSNWAEIRANDFGYITEGSCDHLPEGPCGDKAWAMRGDAPVFAATRDLIHDAQAHNIAVFFITGRSARYQAAMERNLKKMGISGWAGLYMRPVGETRKAELYKTPIRAMIESKGYHIIASIGDQPNDVSGGYNMRGFVLPNPFYSVP